MDLIQINYKELTMFLLYSILFNIKFKIKLFNYAPEIFIISFTAS